VLEGKERDRLLRTMSELYAELGYEGQSAEAGPDPISGLFGGTPNEEDEEEGLIRHYGRLSRKS
jgi:hypothetical protein